MMGHAVQNGFVPEDRLMMYRIFDDAEKMLLYLEQEQV